jgi:hypothetical protein
MIDTAMQNSTAISRPVSPALLLGLSAATRAENSVEELGMIRTQMGSTKDQKIVAVAWYALCDTTL